MEENTEKPGGLDSLFREDTSVEGPDCYGHSGDRSRRWTWC